MKKGDQRRPLSVGTVVMLVMLAIVLVGSAAVLGRLSSGASVDLDKLNMQILDLQNGLQNGGSDSGNTTAGKGEQADKPVGFPETPGNASVSDNSVQEEPAKETNPAQTAVTATEKPATDAKPAETAPDGAYTLTVAGTVSLEGEVLKNAWNTDSKTYDLSDMMLLLKPELRET